MVLLVMVAVIPSAAELVFVVYFLRCVVGATSSAGILSIALVG